MSQKLQNGTLKLSIKTWDKDTNGLFDYSTKGIKKSTEAIQNSISLIRNNLEVKSASNELIQENEELLFKIEKKPNSNEYIFENNVNKNMEANGENIAKINNNCWYVCNNNENASFEQNNTKKNNKNKNVNYYLTKNDIIKFGRLKFSLIEVYLYSGDKKYDLQVPDKSCQINIDNSKTENVFNLEREVPILLKANNDEKILCILMNKKRTVKTYYINRFNCEICKTPYPFRFKIPGNNKIFELIDIIRPQIGNYIVLESLDQVKENNNNKYIHIIKLVDQEDITIGRGIDADVKINDISVSRLHSKLNFNFDKKSLLIRDCDSKFGTLVLIKNKFELKERESLTIQIGRSLINAKVIKYNKKKIFGFKKVLDNKENEEVTEENINIENENFHKFKITFLSENESEKHLGENESNNNSLSMDIV